MFIIRAKLIKPFVDLYATSLYFAIARLFTHIETFARPDVVQQISANFNSELKPYRIRTCAHVIKRKIVILAAMAAWKLLSLRKYAVFKQKHNSSSDMRVMLKPLSIDSIRLSECYFVCLSMWRTQWMNARNGTNSAFDYLMKNFKHS